MQDRMTDEMLAQMAEGGDIKAFEELFDRYKRPIMNFLFRVLGNAETAEEVAIETFMNAYNNLDAFDPNRRFSTWLYTISRNLAKNAIRDKKYFRDVSMDAVISEDGTAITLKDILVDDSVRPDIAAESEELSRMAQNVLDSMPVKYREVIALCCVQGMTGKEAAAILNCSAANISRLLTEAKVLFMKRLGIDPEGK